MYINAVLINNFVQTTEEDVWPVLDFTWGVEGCMACAEPCLGRPHQAQRQLQLSLRLAEPGGGHLQEFKLLVLIACVVNAHGAHLGKQKWHIQHPASHIMPCASCIQEEHLGHT
eukprot:3976892-Lingulodinium_polyedra.AAC.2